MIRVDEAVSGRPEARYGLGLYTATLLLGSLTVCLGLNMAFSDLPLWMNGAAVGLLGALLGIVFAARPALADSMRSLSHGEVVAGWLVSAALFSAASVVFGRWLPVIGLVALQIPTLFTLVTERGYARYYVVCGLTLALSLADIRMPTPLSVGILSVFFLLMVVTLAYENFYFGLENAPPGAQVGISAWLPLRVAVIRFGIATAVTAPLAWLTPVPDVRPGEPAADLEVAPRTSGTLDVSFTLFEAFLYTMVLILLLLAFGALVRWIRTKRRRKRDAELPESLGTPIGGIHPLSPREPAPPPPDPTSPLGRIVRAYEVFADATAKRGRPRKPSDTPGEFRRALVVSSAIPEPAVDAITDRFEVARYAPDDATDRQATEFERLVDDTLARMTGTLTPAPDE